MLTGSVASKFHGTGSLQASYVRTETATHLFSAGATSGSALGGSLFGERPQAAQGPVLGHTDRTG